MEEPQQILHTNQNYVVSDFLSEPQLERMKGHVKELLTELGEDPSREGLLKTPERVSKALHFLTKGYQEDPLAILRAATFREDYQQMVIVRDIDFYSLCEHHMLPFFGKVHAQQVYHGTQQDTSHRRCFRPSSTGAGATDHTDQRLHPAGALTARRHRCYRGTAHVYADAWRTEAKLAHYDERLHGSLQRVEDS